MIEESPNLRFGDATNGKGGKPCFRKETHIVSFDAGGRLSAQQLAVKEDLVCVKGHRRMPLAVSIEHGKQLSGPCAVPGLFEYLAHGSFRRRVIDVGPAARQRPQPIGALSNKQYLLVEKDDASNVHLWSRVPDLTAEESLNRLELLVRAGGYHFLRHGSDDLISLDIEGVTVVCQPILRGGGQPFCPDEPLWIHARSRSLYRPVAPLALNHPIARSTSDVAKPEGYWLPGY
jgi:hypothetical protein